MTSILIDYFQTNSRTTCFIKYLLLTFILAPISIVSLDFIIVLDSSSASDFMTLPFDELFSLSWPFFMALSLVVLVGSIPFGLSTVPDPAVTPILNLICVYL